MKLKLELIIFALYFSTVNTQCDAGYVIEVMPTVDDFMFLSASSTAVIKCWNMSRVAKRKHLPEAERFFHYDEHSRVAEKSIYFINGTENGRYVLSAPKHNNSMRTSLG